MSAQWEFAHPTGNGDCVARWDGALLTVDVLDWDNDADDGWDQWEEALIVGECLCTAASTLDVARRELHAWGIPWDEIKRVEVAL